MNNKIKKIGTVQKIDKDEYIINDLSLDNIQQAYKPILNDVLAFYKKKFDEKIHSIYIRGSVAKGIAIPNIADLDTIAVAYNEIAEEDLLVKKSFGEEMDNKYPFLNGVELHFINLAKVKVSKRTQFLLQTQCLCVNGTDLRKEIPKYGIGEWAYAHSKSLKNNIEDVKKILLDGCSTERLLVICAWMMKMIVRTGFELVMVKEQCFTRDLYPCYEMFSKHYPKKSNDMLAALKLAIFPTIDTDQILKVLNSLNDFLSFEVEKMK